MREIFYCLTLTFLLCSCEMSSYKKGDGDNSYLQSSFGNMKTNSDAQVSSLLLDNDTEITLTEKKSIDGVKADTIYRGLIYYSTAEGQTKLVGFSSSLVCSLISKSKIKDFKQDPVDIESAWISENGKYLNLALLTKIGAVSDGGKMALGIALEHKSKTAGGNYHYYLSLYHDQSTVPEYYTDKTYLSLPLTIIQKGDSITIDYTNNEFQVTSYKLQVK